MKLIFELETMELDDQIVAIPIGENRDCFQGVAVVNETGALILSLLKEETSEEEIVQRICEQYEGPKETIIADVHRYIEEFRKRNLLTE